MEKKQSNTSSFIKMEKYQLFSFKSIFITKMTVQVVITNNKKINKIKRPIFNVKPS